MNFLLPLAILGGGTALLFARKGAPAIPRKGETWMVSMTVASLVPVPEATMMQMAASLQIKDAVFMKGSDSPGYISSLRGKLLLTEDNQIPLTVEMGGALFKLAPLHKVVA